MTHTILRYFSYTHLPETLQPLSKLICEVAEAVDNQLPDSAEKSAGLRKLLEAKDCFVRAALPPLLAPLLAPLLGSELTPPVAPPVQLLLPFGDTGA
jgi:hypothetical protein